MQFTNAFKSIQWDDAAYLPHKMWATRRQCQGSVLVRYRVIHANGALGMGWAFWAIPVHWYGIFSYLTIYNLLRPFCIAFAIISRVFCMEITCDTPKCLLLVYELLEILSADDARITKNLALFCVLWLNSWINIRILIC